MSFFQWSLARILLCIVFESLKHPEVGQAEGKHVEFTYLEYLKSYGKHTGSNNSLLAEAHGVIRCDSGGPGAFSTLPKGSQHIGSMTSSANGAGVWGRGRVWSWQYPSLSIPIHFHPSPYIGLRLGHVCKIKTFYGLRSEEPRWCFRLFSWLDSLGTTVASDTGDMGQPTIYMTESWRDV